MSGVGEEGAASEDGGEMVKFNLASTDEVDAFDFMNDEDPIDSLIFTHVDSNEIIYEPQRRRAKLIGKISFKCRPNSGECILNWCQFLGLSDSCSTSSTAVRFVLIFQLNLS